MKQKSIAFLKFLAAIALGLGGATFFPLSAAIALPPTNYTDPIGYPASWPTTWTPYTSGVPY